ncbi:MAG: DUF5309 family protein [Woeseia sp.]
MATADYLSAADLKAALSGGLLNEDVRQQVYNLGKGIPTPFTDLAGSGTFKNSYSEWTQDDPQDVDLNNAVIDGADAGAPDDAVGTRSGNHAQISDKVASSTQRAENVSSIGNVGSLAYQTAMRTNDLRRDIEAIALTGQASVADNGDSTAGKSAGFSAVCVSNDSLGTSGTATGFNTSTKVVAVVVAGESRALTLAMIRTAVEAIYNKGGNPSVLMSRPPVTKAIGTFLLSSSGAPYRAAPTANVSGTAPANQTAQGYVDVIVTDFGVTLKIVPNRLQQTYQSVDSPEVASADVFLIDPDYVELAYLYGYKVEDLAKLGLSNRKQITTDWMLRVLREDAHAVIRDIDGTQAVTA